MAVRTDLAAECLSGEASCVEGVRQMSRRIKNLQINEIRIDTEEAAKKIGKPAGAYITLETGRLAMTQSEQDEAASEIAKELKKLLPTEGTVLTVGLGNSSITPDAIGPLSAEHILVTRHLEDELPLEHPLRELRGVAAIAPGVLGQTGIEASEITLAVCKKINPAAVVVIDALACSDINRLGSTIQLTDTGISPGSGVGNRRKELSEKTLGVPVIAMGVPTVVDLHTAAENLTGEAPAGDMPNMMVTPRDVDLMTEHAARIMAMGLNLALQPDLTPEEIRSLC